jgi:transposase
MVSFWTVHGMLEVMDVVDTGRRRWFSMAEKIPIVEGSLSGPNMVRSTARRYGVAVSELYLWRRQYQRGGLGGVAPTFHADEFFPAAAAAASQTPVPCGVPQAEIVLVGGRRLVVAETIDPAVLTRLVPVVERA